MSAAEHRPVDEYELTKPARTVFSSIQALRAIASLFVVAFHATVLWRDRFPGTARIWENGNAGVDLFFVVSGFVIVFAASSPRARAAGWRGFVVQRFIRVAPLYWLASTAKLIGIAVVPALAIHASPTVWNAVASYLFIPSRDAHGEIVPLLAVGWTLSFEVLFYAIFAGALAAGLAPLPVAAVSLGCVAAAAWFRTADWPAVGAMANPMTLEFLVGALIAKAQLRRPLGARAGWPMLLAGVAGLVVLSLVQTTGVWERTLIWGTAAGAVLTAAVAFEAHIARPLQVLAGRLGNASYALYLVHGFVLPVAGVALVRLGTGEAWFGPAVIGLSLIASVGAALLVHCWIEAPISAWLRHAANFGQARPRRASVVAA